MTVLENPLVAATALNVTAHRREFEEKAREVLGFLTTYHLTNEYGRALSGGQQRMIEVA